MAWIARKDEISPFALLSSIPERRRLEFEWTVPS